MAARAIIGMVSPSVAAILVFLAVGGLALAYNAISLSLRRAKFARSNGCKPAPHHANKIPFIGVEYMLELKNAYQKSRVLDKFSDDLRIYGSTFQFSLFGGEVLVSKDPAILQSVLATNFDDWGVQDIRHAAVAPLLGQNSFFITDGHAWKLGRGLTKPALARSEYSNLSRFDQFVTKFLALIPTDGSVVDLEPLFARLLQDIGSAYFFGTPVGALEKDASQSNQAVLQAIMESSEGLMKRVSQGGLVKFLPLEKTFANSIKILHAFIDKNIDHCLAQRAENKAESSKRTDFINDLANDTTDRKFMRGISLTMFVGASDTSHNTLTNIIYCLARHPAVYAKLRAEVLTLGSGELDLQAIYKLPYLRAVINETMRLYSIAPFTVRSALRDTILPTGGGPDGKSPLFVTKGTGVLTMFGELSRDPATWGADAEDYRPERFLDTDRKIDTRTFMPFGIGGRACPGQNLAMANMSYTLVRMLREFKEITPADDSKYVESVRFIIANASGCKVKVVRA